MYKKTVESYGIDFTQMHPAYTADTKSEYVTEETQDMITEIPTEKIAEAEGPTVIVDDPVADSVTETPATESITEEVPATIEDAPATVTKTTSRKKSKK